MSIAESMHDFNPHNETTMYSIEMIDKSGKWVGGYEFPKLDTKAALRIAQHYEREGSFHAPRAGWINDGEDDLSDADVSKFQALVDACYLPLRTRVYVEEDGLVGEW